MQNLENERAPISATDRGPIVCSFARVVGELWTDHLGGDGNEAVAGFI